MPQDDGLATADVYAEADRLAPRRGALRAGGDAAARCATRSARGASPLDYPEHLVNDLQPAAVSLRPQIEEVLAALAEAGAAHAMVTGSGPTAFGLFPDDEAAEEAAAALRGRWPEAIATGPLYGGGG